MYTARSTYWICSTPPDPGAGSDDPLAGWIPCFPAPGDGWSFARLDDAGRVVELREKVRISDHATVGLYWFASAAQYCEIYRDYYAVAGREEKGERFHGLWVELTLSQIVRENSSEA